MSAWGGTAKLCVCAAGFCRAHPFCRQQTCLRTCPRLCCVSISLPQQERSGPGGAHHRAGGRPGADGQHPAPQSAAGGDRSSASRHASASGRAEPPELRRSKSARGWWCSPSSWRPPWRRRPATCTPASCGPPTASPSSCSSTATRSRCGPWAAPAPPAQNGCTARPAERGHQQAVPQQDGLPCGSIVLFLQCREVQAQPSGWTQPPASVLGRVTRHADGPQSCPAGLGPLWDVTRMASALYPAPASSCWAQPASLCRRWPTVWTSCTWPACATSWPLSPKHTLV